MRKYTKSWVSSIFLGALALSFGIWGIADIFRGTGDTNVYTIGSTAVPVEEFAREFHNAVRQTGTALTPDQSKALGQQVLDTMTMRTALDNVTTRLGLTATQGRVQQSIQQIGAFSGPLGTFDFNTYLARIQQAGYSDAEFQLRSRQDLARGQMLHAVEGGVAAPPDYARAIFTYAYELRAAEYIVLTPAMAGAIAPPSEAVLAAYVKAHPDNFSTPEYRSVSYAAISVDDIASTISVSDKQIQDEIDANKGDYIKPEKRALEQIRFNSEAEAKAAKTAIDGGKSFDALATERKLQDRDYKLGDVVQADLDPARGQALFALPQNQVSAPVKSTFGWVLMRVTSITPGSSKSHDDVKAIIQKKLAADKITDIANAYTDAISGGAGIEEAARKAGMHFTKVAAVDAQGNAPDGSKVFGASADPELLGAIFKAEVGDEGDPFQTRDGLRTYAVKVDGVTPPKLKPLDAVRAQATQRWQSEQQLKQLRAKAAALAARASAEHSLAGAASSIGAAVQMSTALNRGTTTGLFSADVTRMLFETAPGAAFSAAAGPDSFIVARVTGVKHPQPPPNDPRYLQFVNQFSGDIASDIVQTLAKAVQKKDGLTVNQKLVDATVGGSGS